MLIVKELNCEFVVENRLRFLKGNTMLSEVRGGLGRVPFKPDHQYIVFMIVCVSSCAVMLSYAGEQLDVTDVLAVYPFTAWMQTVDAVIGRFSGAANDAGWWC